MIFFSIGLLVLIGLCFFIDSKLPPPACPGTTGNQQKIRAMLVIFFIDSLGGGFKYFVIFTPIPGEMIQFDEHIFQMHGLKPPTSSCFLSFPETKSVAVSWHILGDRLIPKQLL